MNVTSSTLMPFFNFDHFDSNLAPFLNSKLTRLAWLKQRFPCETLGLQLELIEIWSAFLTWVIIFVGITSKDIRFYPYQPQLFARQFKLCHFPPMPMYRKMTRFYQIQSDESLIPKVINKKTPKVKLQFHPSSLENCFLSTQDFHQLWWQNYYSRRPISTIS